MDKDKAERAEIPAFEDVLTELLRSGARELIMEAVQAEMSTFMASYQGLKLSSTLHIYAAKQRVSRRRW